MVKKVELKTDKNKTSVKKFIDNIEDDLLRDDSKKLLALFKKVTKLKPVMWGTSIIGFGEYTYHRSNGDEGVYLATGFSPRKTGPTLYIMPGYQDYSEILKDIGKHKTGKSCLYLKSLKDTNLEALEKLIKTGMKDLKKSHETNF
ncbi:MAG: DUF1801 domain-containing protein [Oligoflexales bacterium]